MGKLFKIEFMLKNLSLISKKSMKKKIAIDTITLTKEACPFKPANAEVKPKDLINCDFTTDTCGWINDPSVKIQKQ